MCCYRWLVAFMETPEEPAWHGYFYAVCLLVLGFIGVVLLNLYYKSVTTISARTMTALMAAVYNKVRQAQQLLSFALLLFFHLFLLTLEKTAQGPKKVKRKKIAYYYC